MSFLPIVLRELIEAARRRSTHRIRVVAAVAGLLVGGYFMIIGRLFSGGAGVQITGLPMFIGLAVVTYVYCLLAGVFRTADCLSEEKREGTLGLLFLTSLRGYDVVLGKLVASGVNALYGVMALCPIMAIPLLMGGVSAEEFWRVVLSALNLLFFSMSVGMFASAISRDERRSMVITVSTLVVFTGGLPLLAGFLESRTWGRPYFLYALVPSPGYAAVTAFDSSFKAGGTLGLFYPSLVCTHVLSWVCLGLAARIVPRSWQETGAGPGGPERSSLIERLLIGSRESRIRLRNQLLEINPIYWLTARRRGTQSVAWGVLGLMAFIWFLGWWFDGRDWVDEGALGTFSVLSHVLLKLCLAVEACRRFSVDRRNGAMELLLSTPLPVREILRGQWLGLQRQFGGPALVLLLTDLLFMLNGSRTTNSVLTWAVWMGVLVADLAALAWVGMWVGLNSARPNRAAASVLARVLFLPWVVFLILIGLGALSDFAGRRLVDFTYPGLLVVWMLFGLAADMAFAVPAHRRLEAEFREVATRRSDTQST